MKGPTLQEKNNVGSASHCPSPFRWSRRLPRARSIMPRTTTEYRSRGAWKDAQMRSGNGAVALTATLAKQEITAAMGRRRSHQPTSAAVGLHPSGIGRCGCCALRARVARGIPRPQRACARRAGNGTHPSGAGRPRFRKTQTPALVRCPLPSNARGRGSGVARANKFAAARQIKVTQASLRHMQKKCRLGARAPQIFLLRS